MMVLALVWVQCVHGHNASSACAMECGKYCSRSPQLQIYEVLLRSE